MIILFTIGFAPYLTQDAFAQPEPELIETRCYNATIELDQNQYFLSDYYHITLVAPNKNHNSDVVETASIAYWEVGKSKGGMALEETGFDTGIFTTEGVNDRLSPYQVSKHVESAPAQFMISFYDACTGDTIQDVAEILSGDGPVVEPEPLNTHCYNGATIEFDQDEYLLSDYYYVTVVSPDENHNPYAVETASVLYWAEGTNKGGMELEETGTDTGIFTNTGLNDHLSPYQVSKHVKSTPTYFLMSYYDACSGNTVQDHAKIYSDDPKLIEVPTGTDVVIPLGASVPGCENTYECYFPYRETINVGETVMWFNQDSEWHTVTSGTPEDGPNGLFDSGKIENGQTFEHTFTQPGIYPYFDIAHPWAKGEIRALGSVISSSDTTPPQVIVPSDIILDESTADYITLEYDVKAIDDVDGVITPTCDFESGYVFRSSEIERDTIPRILVECTATDSAGNTGSNHFMVTFVSIPDTTPPVVITFDANMTIDAGTDEYAKLEYFVKAIDEVDGLMTPTCDIRSGSVIPVGQWLVTCTATDSAGNTGSISFMVTITSSSDTSSLDTTPPHVMVPSDMIIYPGTDDFVKLEYFVKAIDDVDGVITPTCDVGSGSVISVVSVERLLVTCTATDSAGNTGSTSFTVTITSIPDTTPPVVITSGDMTIDAGTDYYVKFEYDVKAFDDVDGVITPTCDRPSGSLVAVDYLSDFFLFTCTATDSAGNTGSDRFFVTVTRPEPTPESTYEPVPEYEHEPVPEYEHEPVPEPTTPVMPSYADVILTEGSAVPGCEETNECYIPYRTTINVGESVIWSNVDTAAHTVTSGTTTDGPDGVFDSSLFGAGDTFSWKPDSAGEFSYFCMIHPWTVGKIIVKATTVTSILTPLPVLEPEPEPTGFDGITVDSSVPDQTEQNTFEDTLDNAQEQIDNDISNPPSQDSDLTKLFEENRKLREELGRQGEQIDELNEEVDLLKQIIQSIQGFFGSIFG